MIYNILTVKELKKTMEDLPDDSLIVIYYKNKSNDQEPDLCVEKAFSDYCENVLVLEAVDFK